MLHDQWAIAKVKTIGPKSYALNLMFDEREVLEVVSKGYDEHSTAERICSRRLNAGKYPYKVTKLEDGRFEVIGYQVVAYDSRYKVAGFQGGPHMYRIIRQERDGMRNKYSYGDVLTKDSINTGA